ncbi:MAG: zinc ribbon domain-containing protein [Clostridiales bacterium]|nr:zinc ribbon domain-containing protein [Clostridiales bacterium]
MKELKQAIRNLVNSQQILVSMLPAAAVLVLIDPVLLLISSFEGLSFYNLTAGLFFVAYLLGLVLCLAADNDWAVGLAFALKAVASLVSFVNYATFSKLVYVALYGVLAYFFLRAFFQTEQGQKMWSNVSNGARAVGNSVGNNGGGNGSYNAGRTANGAVICGNCGLTVSEGGAFCPRCGAPLPQAAAPEQPTERFCPRCGRKLEPGARFCAYCGPEAGPVDAPGGGASGGSGIKFGPAGPVTGGSSGTTGGFGGGSSYGGTSVTGGAPVTGGVAGFCSGGIFLIFTAVLTLQLACSIVLQFNILSVIASIPSIVLCVGLWQTWSGSNRGQLRSNGFRLMSGALLAELIIACIPLVLLVLLAFLAMSAGDDGITVGLILIVSAVLCFLLFRLYWLGLRKTAQSAAAVVDGYGTRVEVTLFPIVILFISAAISLISLVGMSSSYAALSSILNSARSYINMYAGSYGIDSSLVNSIISSFYPDWKAYVVQLLSAAAPICAGLMLISARNRSADQR